MNRSFFRSFAARLFSIGILTLCILLQPFTRPMYGDVRFREYGSDKERLEHYIERADQEASGAEWESIVASGRESLKASWEEEAERELRDEILDENLSEAEIAELEAERDLALADWEAAADAAIAAAKGSWFARRQQIVFGELDRESLSQAFSDARATASFPKSKGMCIFMLYGRIKFFNRRVVE